MISGGELITRVLAASGLRTVFAVAGASHTHLLAALDDAGFSIVSNRHEAGAVGSADGYARVSGKPGVAMIVADQGLPNAIGALAVAWHASSPVVLLVATPPRSFVETDAGIDQDKLALVASISKWARTVPSEARLDDYLRTALRHAMTGRPGPAVLLIPEQILQREVAPPDPQPIPAPSRPAPAPDAIHQAAECLRNAQRPMIVAGAGVAWGNAATPLRRLVDQFNLPLLANSLGRGQVPEDSQRVMSWPFGQLAAHRADVVLLAGARLTQRLGLGLPPRFAADAKFLQIDIEPGAFHRNRAAVLAIHADTGLALTALVDNLDAAGVKPFDDAWLQAEMKERRERVAQLAAKTGPSIHPLRLGAALMPRLPRRQRLCR